MKKYILLEVYTCDECGSRTVMLGNPKHSHPVNGHCECAKYKHETAQFTRVKTAAIVKALEETSFD